MLLKTLQVRVVEKKMMERGVGLQESLGIVFPGRKLHLRHYVPWHHICPEDPICNVQNELERQKEREKQRNGTKGRTGRGVKKLNEGEEREN